MKNKTKIVFRVGARATKKVMRGDLKYNGKHVTKISYGAGKYLFKYGPRAFIHKAKQEIVRIDRRIGSNLYFPNGLVSGVDEAKVLSWYNEKSKPVTVVIPSYNDLEVLVPCLDSIASTTSSDRVKVLVVDDYCHAEHSKKLRQLENEQVKIIFRDKNGGFAKAVNTGLRAADPDHDVVLINSDIVAHPGWVEGLQYGAYEFGVDTGIVGPKLLYPDGRIQSAGSYRNTEATEWFDHYYRFQDANYGPANIPQYCIAVTGACMYIKREFMDYVGILDDNFQFAFEDVDLCLRGWEAGYRTLYFPSATLTHMESATRSKNTQISEKEKQSVEYFWSKWKKWFDERNVRNTDGKIRIIFVLQSLGNSGGIKIVFEHANKLPKDKFDVEIWGLDMHQPAWELSKDVRLRTFKNYERLTSVLSEQDAIKVATWWETAFPVWLASVRKGIPVYFIQEFETWFYPNDVVAQSVVVSCYRKEFKNMTTSRYNMSEIEALGLKATPIPCGYDERIFRPLPSVERKNNMLLAAGRKFFQKNFDFTLKGWQASGEKRPELVLFGAEPELERLDRKIRYITKPTNEEVNELYNQSTVFIQTSRHEGFCLPLLEAMATGAPVICTDAHGNRDFCIDNKNCIMVEHDNIDELSAAIKKLFKDSRLRNRLSTEALKTAKKYRWSIIMKKVEQFYTEVAN